MQEELRESFDPKSHRYAWRRKLAANPVSDKTYRIGVAIVGLIIVAVGIAAVPLPGPGWLIVFIGLGVWATEFLWAARLLNWAREKLDAWNAWFKRQPLWFQGLFALLTFAFVCFIVWLTLRIGGVPGFLPSGAKDFLRAMPGL
ncbi:TIGR02611 family protein [Calidifontibacter terrae]